MCHIIGAEFTRVPHVMKFEVLSLDQFLFWSSLLLPLPDFTSSVPVTSPHKNYDTRFKI
jgi:hypothetical protein